MRSQIGLGSLMDADNDPILAAVLRYTAPVALLSIVLTIVSSDGYSAHRTSHLGCWLNAGA